MLFVLVPVHNRLEDTVKFIKCVESQTTGNFELIVIDDGSSDGTNELIKLHYSWVTLLEGDGTLWWTGAINRGVEYVLGKAGVNDLLMTINNDVIFEDNFFQTMMETASTHPDSLVNPVSIDATDRERVMFTGGRVFSWIFAIKVYPLLNRNVKQTDKRQFVEVDFLSGRGTMIPVKAFREIGLYNQEKLPHYGADEEFTIRARRNGYRVLINLGAIVYVEKATTGLNPTIRRLAFREMKLPRACCSSCSRTYLPAAFFSAVG